MHTGAHFPGCFPGKRDHQNAVNTAGMIGVGNPVDHTLHQYRRFAAARGRGN